MVLRIMQRSNESGGGGVEWREGGVGRNVYSASLLLRVVILAVICRWP